MRRDEGHVLRRTLDAPVRIILKTISATPDDGKSRGGEECCVKKYSRGSVALNNVKFK